MIICEYETGYFFCGKPAEYYIRYQYPRDPVRTKCYCEYHVKISQDNEVPIEFIKRLNHNLQVMK